MAELLLSVKKKENIKHFNSWPGLRIPENPFLRTSILNILRGRMLSNPLVGERCPFVN